MFLGNVLVNLINLVLGLVELLLGLRLVLKLLGASPAPFVTWVYESSQPLIAPFEGMFPNPVLTGGIVLEFASLFAVVFYALLGYLIIEVLSFVRHSTSRFHQHD